MLQAHSLESCSISQPIVMKMFAGRSKRQMFAVFVSWVSLASVICIYKYNNISVETAKGKGNQWNRHRNRLLPNVQRREKTSTKGKQVIRSRPAYCDILCRELSTPHKGFPPLIYNGLFTQYVGRFSFRDVADLVMQWPLLNMYYNKTGEPPEFVQRMVPLEKIVPCLGPVPIIYVSRGSYGQGQLGFYLESFRETVLPKIPEGAILITGHSDFAALSQYENYEVLHHSNLVHWYGVEGVTSDPKFTYIPRGLRHDLQVVPINKARGDKSLSAESFRKYIDEILQEVKSGSRKKLLAINFSVRKGVRQRLHKKYCNGNTPEFVTCFQMSLKPCVKGKDEPCHMEDLYLKLSMYPFWLAPSGFGMDTHRNLEAMYLNRFPVLGTSGASPFYSDLPAVIVPDMTRLNTSFLVYELHRLRDRADSFNMDKLRPRYWQETIEGRRRERLKALGITDDVRKRCWGP